VDAVSQNSGMSSRSGTIEWILDSGVQINVCGKLDLFDSLCEGVTSRLDFAKGTSEHATTSGNMLVCVMNQDTAKEEERMLEDVVYAPTAPNNIISLCYMQMVAGFRFRCSSDQRTAWLEKPGIKLKFDMINRIYRLRTKPVSSSFVMRVATPSASSGRDESMELLHQRFGHMGMSTIKAMVSKHMDLGAKVNEANLKPYDCVACIASKAKKMTYHRVAQRSAKLLETLMMDICSIGDTTIGGQTMFLFIVDEASRYKWMYLLHENGEATEYIIELLKRLDREFHKRPVIRLHSDQEGEFLITC
jgi:hypothetical protein